MPSGNFTDQQVDSGLRVFITNLATEADKRPPPQSIQLYSDFEMLVPYVAELASIARGVEASGSTELGYRSDLTIGILRNCGLLIVSHLLFQQHQPDSRAHGESTAHPGSQEKSLLEIATRFVKAYAASSTTFVTGYAARIVCQRVLGGLDPTGASLQDKSATDSSVSKVALPENACHFCETIPLEACINWPGLPLCFSCVSSGAQANANRSSGSGLSDARDCLTCLSAPKTDYGVCDRCLIAASTIFTGNHRHYLDLEFRFIRSLFSEHSK